MRFKYSTIKCDLFRIRGNKTLEIIFRMIFRCLNWCYRFRPLSPPRGGAAKRIMLERPLHRGWKTASLRASFPETSGGHGPGVSPHGASRPSVKLAGRHSCYPRRSPFGMAISLSSSARPRPEAIHSRTNHHHCHP